MPVRLLLWLSKRRNSTVVIDCGFVPERFFFARGKLPKKVYENTARREKRDNACSHTSDTVVKRFARNKIYLIVLATRSPELNITEKSGMLVNGSVTEAEDNIITKTI